MLRALVVAVLAANLLFFGFTLGWFDGLFGLRSNGDREPERVANQVHPEAIVLLPAGTLASAAAAAATCLEAGPFGNDDAPIAEAALRAALPAGSWSEVTVGTVAPGAATHTFRLTTTDPELAARAAALKLDPSGRSFSPCAKP